MAITDSDLQFFYPQTISDASGNGGRMSHLPISTGVDENVFNRVPKSERDSGSKKYRKVFAKVNNNGSDTLYSPGVFLDAITPADDSIHFVIGTHRNTQGDLTGSEPKFGSGTLVSHSGTTLVMDVENTDLTGIIRDGIEIHVSDKVTPTSVSGNEEYATVSDVVSVVGTRLTLTLSAALTFTYAAGSKVSSVYRHPTNLLCTFDNWVKTSAAGLYDQSTYPVEMNNRSTVEQTWTITFLTTSTFNVVGDTVGSVGSGNISTDFSPNNSNFSLPFFTLRAAGFGGTFAQNDTIVFQTHPCSIPIFEIRDIPALSDPFTDNFVDLVFVGEV